jgi:hypothetical protein
MASSLSTQPASTQQRVGRFDKRNSARQVCITRALAVNCYAAVNLPDCTAQLRSLEPPNKKQMESS